MDDKKHISWSSYKHEHCHTCSVCGEFDDCADHRTLPSGRIACDNCYDKEADRLYEDWKSKEGTL